MKSKKTFQPEAEPAATLLQPCDPEALRWEMQQIQLAVARRAYELFESRNREHGHDWEDWFQAESELLRPVSTAVSDLQTASAFASTFSDLERTNSRSASSRGGLPSWGEKSGAVRLGRSPLIFIPIRFYG